jgi:GcrA cell cycle regulator
MSGKTTWDDDQIAKLKWLWNQTDPQLSTSEIGRRLGMTKNAIVGRAHRLHLTGRVSPIRARYSYAEADQAPREAGLWEGPTLPPLASANSDPLQARLESGPPQAWITWCDGLSTSALNEMRRASHKADCMVASQQKSLLLWECTCGVSQPGSDVVAIPVKRQVVSEPVAPIIMRRALPEPIVIAAPTVFKPRRQQPCCWIDGNDKRNFVHCDEPAIVGRSFCQAHAARVYVKIRTRADVTASLGAD